MRHGTQPRLKGPAWFGLVRFGSRPSLSSSLGAPAHTAASLSSSPSPAVSVLSSSPSPSSPVPKLQPSVYVCLCLPAATTGHQLVSQLRLLSTWSSLDPRLASCITLTTWASRRRLADERRRTNQLLVRGIDIQSCPLPPLRTSPLNSASRCRELSGLHACVGTPGQQLTHARP